MDARTGNNFDAIRLFMALAVVWSHSFAIYRGSEATEPISLLLNGIYDAGKIGVLIFFVISGYLICQSYDHHKNNLRFFEKRVRRIYPGYLVATSICAFIVIPIFAQHYDLSAVQILKTLGLNLLLKNYFPPSDVFGSGVINGSLWSIPYEFWCYIGIAAMGSIGLFRIRWSVPFVVVIVMAVRVWLDLTGRKPGGGIIELIIGWQYTWFDVLPCFLAGTTLYLFRDAVRRNGLVALLGIAALLAVAHLPVDGVHRQIITNLVFVPTIAYATICLAFSPTFALHNAARFGDFSYGTYLYAYTIQLIILNVAPDLSFAAYVLVCIVASLVAGITSWYCVERWFLIARHHRFSRRLISSNVFGRDRLNQKSNAGSPT
jgi:peptidoglycan/LPS O-acetylase OafA/YrhL